MRSGLRHLRDVLLLAVVLLLLPGAAGPPTIDEDIEALQSADYTGRFEAAIDLVGRTAEGLDHRLATLRDSDAVQASPEVRTAFEFVLWKRSRAPMPPPAEPTGPHVNFLIISVDTLRPDHLGCYGYARDTSPSIDALAASGTVFENAFTTAPWTLPGHMSLFTSLYPSFHKLDRANFVGSAHLDESEAILAEALSSAGYRTAGFVSHPFLAGEWGYARGFDLYHDSPLFADQQTRLALHWLEWHRFHRNRGVGPRKFFLFLHYLDPHEPYSAPPPDGNRYVSGYQGTLKPEDHFVSMFSHADFESKEDFEYVLGLYDGEIHYVDANLGDIFAGLRAYGFESTTMVQLVSDHGEEFKDHGSMGHWKSLYDSELRVPFIVRYPAGKAAGKRIRTPVNLLDVFPTVLELAGQKVPQSLQGVSLAPYLTAGTARGSVERPRDLFAEFGPGDVEWEKEYFLRAIRSGRYKLIVTQHRSGEIDRELYDVIADPQEQTNLIDTAPADLLRGLEERLNAFVQEGNEYHPEFREKNSIDLQKQLKERLNSLGYVPG